ncbi:hypothetical protein MN086_10250 [Sulfurovum sp. XGS-02]|uniref:hypothetical protein n=1 Tax=Sulfurovum sp. XGS-02 TaxID=2925411 RepID=UPI00206E86B3|nr:hypothetical protein [Sulfurovum sp. XGS-02]UPT77420.1 hypothetical protein MN086_10250 [Sulfurovum sp. XGS-02]
MTNLKTIALSAVAIAIMNGCGDTTVTYGDSTVTITGDTLATGGTTGSTTTNTTPTSFDTILAAAKFLPQKPLAGDISTSMTLTNDTLWVLDGLAVVKPGVTLTIEPGTVIAGLAGTGDATSYMIVDKDAEIIADGTADKPIIFTSMQRVEDPTNLDVGQWGGLTLIGNAGNDQVNAYEVNSLFAAGGGKDANGAIVPGQDLSDSSGILRNVYILNSGITMAQDKEINGLSFVGVGSGTIVEDITIDYSDDDGIEIWGGTVNLTNVTVTHCTDDYFDIDDGFSGTVKNLVINTTTGNAGIEMSGDTAATFDGFTITTGATQAKEGGIYFKNAGIGGHFKNGTIIHNGGQIEPHGALHSNDLINEATTSFENVAITAPEGLIYTGPSASALQTAFEGGSGNVVCTVPTSVTLTGDLTGCTVLTSDKIWELDGLAVVTSGAELRIQEGTTIVGLPGTGDATSYMIVDKGAKIYALGTVDKPIVFTSQNTAAQEVGLWGGLTLIGNAGNDQVNAYEVNSLFAAGGGKDANGAIVSGQDLADSSGILRNVKILNSGITMAQDKEINGLSFVGVGSGTIVEDITIDYSDDDGIEIWGGTVNLTNVTVTHCTDDYFDIDDGFSGTVKNLVINTTTGNAGIEMSGDTAATFDGFTITTGATQAKEGGIYFKNAGIGGHFKNGTIIHNGGQIEPHGALHSNDLINEATTSFENVAMTTGTGLDFTGTSAAALEVAFDDGGATGNTITYK